MIHRSLAPQSIKFGDHFFSDNVEYEATCPPFNGDKTVIVWARRANSNMPEEPISFNRTDLVEVICER